MNDFHGHPVETIDNGKIKLSYLTDIGPRIIGMSANDSANLFAELPHLTSETQHGAYHFLGGHRLWRAPESFEHTYVPDQAVSIERSENRVLISATPEPHSGLVKSVEIQLAEGKASATITHTFTNTAASSTSVSPWALSMLRQGGAMLLPQPAATEGEAALLPNRRLVLWPYTHITDPRLKLGDDFVFVRAQPAMPPIKIGYYNAHGWAAYMLDGWLLVKRFSVKPAEDHPDGGSNVEVYCNDLFIELETLGPLTSLAPGASLTHVENWELLRADEQDLISPDLISG